LGTYLFLLSEWEYNAFFSLVVDVHGRAESEAAFFWLTVSAEVLVHVAAQF
jgi:hypothetical protein